MTAALRASSHQHTTAVTASAVPTTRRGTVAARPAVTSGGAGPDERREVPVPLRSGVVPADAERGDEVFGRFGEVQPAVRGVERVVDAEALAARRDAGDAVHLQLEDAGRRHDATEAVLLEADRMTLDAAELADHRREARDRAAGAAGRDRGDRLGLLDTRAGVDDHPDDPAARRHDLLRLRHHGERDAGEIDRPEVPRVDAIGHREVAEVLSRLAGRVGDDAGTEVATAAGFRVLAADRPRGAHDACLIPLRGRRKTPRRLSAAARVPWPACGRRPPSAAKSTASVVTSFAFSADCMSARAWLWPAVFDDATP